MKNWFKNPYHPDNKMSAYTVNRDNLFYDEKTIACLQKLNSIFQLRLITLYDDNVESISTLILN